MLYDPADVGIAVLPGPGFGGLEVVAALEDGLLGAGSILIPEASIQNRLFS